MAKDIHRAAEDPYYRMLYEHERTMEAHKRTTSRLHDDAKRRSEEAENRRSWAAEDSKVICTELVRQGKLSRADYLAGARYVEEHLTERHMRGYHAWALPVVRRMRRSQRATAFWRVLAQARADHIAFLGGNAARRNRIGAVLCAIFHPACFLIGGLVGEQDWRSLYRDEAAA